MGSYGKIGPGYGQALGNPYIDNMYAILAQNPNISQGARDAFAAGPQYAPPTDKKGFFKKAQNLIAIAPGSGSDGMTSGGGTSDYSSDDSGGMGMVPKVIGGIAVLGLGYLAYKQYKKRSR